MQIYIIQDFLNDLKNYSDTHSEIFDHIVMHNISKPRVRHKNRVSASKNRVSAHMKNFNTSSKMSSILKVNKISDLPSSCFPCIFVFKNISIWWKQWSRFKWNWFLKKIDEDLVWIVKTTQFIFECWTNKNFQKKESKPRNCTPFIPRCLENLEGYILNQ